MLNNWKTKRIPSGIQKYQLQKITITSRVAGTKQRYLKYENL